MEIELLVATSAGPVPVTVAAEPAASAGDLRRALLDLGIEPVLAVPDDRPLAALRLRPGTVLPGPAGAATDPNGAATDPAGGPAYEVAVVGGLAAGARVALAAGRAVLVGRGDACDLRLADPEASRRHATVRLADGRASIADAGSLNGVRHGGFRLTGECTLGPGGPDALIGVGESVLAVRPAARTPADLAPGLDGQRLVNRPPRIAAPERRPELAVPAPPGPARRVPVPWLATLAPAVLCGALYLVLPAGGYGVYLLAMMALSPVLALANLVSGRRAGRREHARAVAAYTSDRRAYDAELAAAVALDAVESRAAHPDPAELAARALAPAATLWPRRPGDGDFLSLRVGLYDRPARVGLRAADAAPPPAPLVRDVPLAVQLPAAGVLGVAGPRPMVLAAARALLVQAATLHSPADLGLVLLTGRDTAADWDWLTWLPQTLPGPAGSACLRLVATDAAQAEARLAELRRLVEERVGERRAALAQGPPPGRALLVVLDGARRLRDLPGLTELLAAGPAVGVHALCLDADETALPAECGATVVASNPAGTRATVRRRGLNPAADVLVDGVPAGLATEVARALCGLRPLGGAGADATIPDRARLLDLLDPAPLGPAASDRCTRAVLGVGPNGPISVDLRRDGPHALVAGTSGAGKSELLQTLVTSLALANAPDALTFVLVDYKGGSAFAECARLPHCVGLITDLDGHLVRRALDSLSAELRRRERLFAAVGAGDIEEYWSRCTDRLPRLVIVVDEFASLVEEQPEFVPGVVGIGMRGRSLGVHVVLATQRPAGVVTADLRANVNLRICLRVTSSAESMDVIDAPDAARIPPRRPGRAFVRRGPGDLTEFQAARVSWPRPVAGPATTPVRVTRRRIEDLGAAPPVAAEPDTGPTDLTTLVDGLVAAAAALAPPRRPWLPPLPEVVTLDEIAAPGLGVAAGVLGLADWPAAQAQGPFVLDLDSTGCVAVAGTVRSGRSTALRTIAAALAAGASPAEVHLYALDCGNQALASLTALPHCAAVVAGDDDERAERLFGWLHEEVTRRQRLLAGAGHAGLAEHRRATAEAERLPSVVLLLDRVEAFLARHAERDGGRLVDRLESLLRAGPAVGVLTVLGTDRSGFPHRIASAVAARLVLRQASPDDVAAYGLDPRAVPGRPPPGRAVWSVTGEEVQVALLDPDPAGAAQAAALRRLGSALAARWDGLAAHRLPHRLDPLPDDIAADAAEALRRSARPAGAAVCTPAVGGDALGPVDVDLAEAGGAFVIAGPARSGRSTALVAVVTSLAGRADAVLPVLLLTPRRSPLRELANLPGVCGLITDDPAEMAVRVADAAVLGPAAIVIDDAELLTDHRLADALEAFVRAGRDAGSLLIAAATTDDLLANPYRGWLAAARRARSGLLLNPASHVDGEVFGLRLPRSTGGGWPPGRGLLVLRGEACPVQLIRPTAAARFDAGAVA